ncbi:MAG: aminomethyl-transferring glycine dehydrogenase, partial [Bacteroidota bacterium]|nr:aminomethyl-transferring glycine dehydrogenase [Bacteroidota bacterium]
MNLFEKLSVEFEGRHIGPNELETREMLQEIGADSLEMLMDRTIPKGIRLPGELPMAQPMDEHSYLEELGKIAAQNKVFRSFIGQGYYDTITPTVIQRSLFENPGWYTQYTPYQAEIAQGRLESLLNFQTMVSDLTALPIANASLLDEGTAAAEAMTMIFNHRNKDHDHISAPKFFVDAAVFNQTREVLQTRALPIGIELVTGNLDEVAIDGTFFGAIVQYPDARGTIRDYREFINRVHEAGALVVMATDLLALTLLTPPGELGADVAIGSSQRLGVPLGFGGPHAAFFATRDEFKRNIPGRIIGVSIDAKGNRCLRMALQTREQHIRREKATSNICTAQALLANMAAMYVVYHGPQGLKAIAERVALLTQNLAESLKEADIEVKNEYFFDTLTIGTENAARIRELAENTGINFYYPNPQEVRISIDETCVKGDLLTILHVFNSASGVDTSAGIFDNEAPLDCIPRELRRTSSYLQQEVFNTHHSETELMRYLKMLENKDLSLVHSMIPLGSCTMKLNAATEIIPVSWPQFSRIHPFAPETQTAGYQYIIRELEGYLCKITGFAACSLQPNSGAQGEFAGLLTIRAFHERHGDLKRDVILIPVSAHGTNPASAVMAGFKVAVVKCDAEGNIDMADLKTIAEKNKEVLAGLMVTYPSTHGVFEETIREICEVVHEFGGLVYMDGANMNAQVGLTSPGYIGADVCHLNLHKTFAIPHGGGGPGMGPICVNEKLAPFLPGRPGGAGMVSATRYSSASILLISYAYIKLLGNRGLKKASVYAILNANYMKARLKKYFKILYTG